MSSFTCLIFFNKGPDQQRYFYLQFRQSLQVWFQLTILSRVESVRGQDNEFCVVVRRASGGVQFTLLPRERKGKRRGFEPASSWVYIYRVIKDTFTTMEEELLLLKKIRRKVHINLCPPIVHFLVRTSLLFIFLEIFP